MTTFMIITALACFASFTVALVQHEKRHQEMKKKLQESQERYTNPEA